MTALQFLLPVCATPRLQTWLRLLSVSAEGYAAVFLSEAFGELKVLKNTWRSIAWGAFAPISIALVTFPFFLLLDHQPGKTVFDPSPAALPS